MTAAQDPSTSAAPEISHLQSSFLSRPLSSHPAIWDKHWKDSFSPWDRGGPSLALDDLLTNHRELFPSVKSGGPKPRALVPGCGRGHDVLLLSAFGYDVTGLDVSEAGLLEAAENQRLNGGEPVYAARNREGAVTEKGSVAWMKADFFDEQNSSLESGSFDLIYDYTVSFYFSFSPCCCPAAWPAHPLHALYLPPSMLRHLIGSVSSTALSLTVLLCPTARGKAEMGKENGPAAEARWRQACLS